MQAAPKLRINMRRMVHHRVEARSSVAQLAHPNDQVKVFLFVRHAKSAKNQDPVNHLHVLDIMLSFNFLLVSNFFFWMR